jgi:single-stranded DNA-specific DHH superfamily exonuclease
VICKAMGESGRGHMADRCTYSCASKLKEYMDTVRTQIKYDPYSGCWECGVWQGICNGWEKNVNNGRWKKRSSGKCQYAGVLIRAVVAIWASVGDMFEQDMNKIMVSMGLERLRELNHGGFQQVIEFFGKRWRVGEMESNRITQMFVRWADMCSGSEV